MTTLQELARMTLAKAAAPAGKAALFVDMAGVLLDATPSPGQPAGLRAGVGPALRLLDRLDYRVIVLAPCALDRRQMLRPLPARIADLLARERVSLSGFCCCTCTSAPCPDCPPSAMLLQRAAREQGLVLARSWLLAHSRAQLAAGQRAGCRTFLIGGDDEDGPALTRRPGDGLVRNVARSTGSNADRAGERSTERGVAGHGPVAYRARDVVDAALAIVRLDGAG